MKAVERTPVRSCSMPNMIGMLQDLTGVRSTAFMLLFGVVWVSLIWMYWTEVRRTEFMKSTRTEQALDYAKMP